MTTQSCWYAHTHTHTHTHTHSIREDNGQEAIKLFATKLLIHEIEKFTAPDGGGFGGQVCVGVGLFCLLTGLFSYL